MIQKCAWHEVLEPNLALLDLLFGKCQLQALSILVTYATTF